MNNVTFIGKPGETASRQSVAAPLPARFVTCTRG